MYTEYEHKYDQRQGPTQGQTQKQTQTQGQGQTPFWLFPRPFSFHPEIVSLSWGHSHGYCYDYDG